MVFTTGSCPSSFESAELFNFHLKISQHAVNTTYMVVGSADVAGENICRPCRLDGSILPADSLKITYCTCLFNTLYIVGFSNQRNRVYGFTAIRQTCFYVVACHGAIAGINVGIVLFDFIDHRFANFHGGIVTFTF